MIVLLDIQMYYDDNISLCFGWRGLLFQWLKSAIPFWSQPIQWVTLCHYGLNHIFAHHYRSIYRAKKQIQTKDSDRTNERMKNCKLFYWFVECHRSLQIHRNHSHELLYRFLLQCRASKSARVVCFSPGVVYHICVLCIICFLSARTHHSLPSNVRLDYMEKQPAMNIIVIQKNSI